MPDGEQHLPEVEKLICFALHAAARASEANYRPELARFGLTYPQYLVMLLLWEQDGVSLRQLSARLYLDSGTLTPLLKRLQQNGFIIRTRDTVDERLVRVTLTVAGRAIERQIVQAVQTLACRINIDVAEINLLRDQVHRFRLALNAASAASLRGP